MTHSLPRREPPAGTARRRRWASGSDSWRPAPARRRASTARVPSRSPWTATSTCRALKRRAKRNSLIYGNFQERPPSLTTFPLGSQCIWACLHQALASTLQQFCYDASNTVLIENNGVAQNGLQPQSGVTLLFSRRTVSLASLYRAVAALMLTLGVNGPLR